MKCFANETACVSIQGSDMAHKKLETGSRMPYISRSIGFAMFRVYIIIVIVEWMED